MKNRKQFNKNIASFQIIQEKIVRTLGEIEACMMMALRVADLYIKKQATPGQITMTKAIASKLAHSASAIAREMMGGNGILIENRAIKHLMDA